LYRHLSRSRSRRVGGARSGSVEQTVAAAAREISDGKITKVSELLQFIDKIVPKDPEFEEGFKNATVSQAYLARYYLRALEMTVKNERDPYFIPNDDQQIINLEHVLPEKPEGNWPGFTPELVAAFYKRIGNMALLQAKANSDLRSSSFDEKKAIYRDSPYELTNQIAQINGDWSLEAIAQRQKQMAGLAVKTWPMKIT
jgi:hypothetical protein